MSNYPVSDEILEVGKADPGCGGDTITIPRVQLEAYMAAAKLFYKYRHIFFDHMSIHQSRTEIMPALDALRAAGIGIEE